MSVQKQVEIVILSGFLGSGKTTLLRRVLEAEQKKDRRVAVLMNELGDVSIDSTVVPREIPLKELLNGCICCTIQGQLTKQLLSLYQQHQPDVIYIESTGVAHPIEVLEACFTPLMIPQLKACKIITLVDGYRWQEQERLSIRLRKLFVEQIRHADLLLLNKWDLVSSEEQKKLLQEIKEINPLARLVPAQFAGFDLDLHLFSLPGAFDRRYEALSHDHSHLHVKMFHYTFSTPIDRETFMDWMRKVPDTLYRAKGFLRFTDEPQTLYSFQYSYGLPMLTKETPIRVSSCRSEYGAG